MSAVPDLIGEYRRLQRLPIEEREDAREEIQRVRVQQREDELAERRRQRDAARKSQQARRAEDELAKRRLIREERHAGKLVSALSFEERHEYELEGVTRIVIGGLSIAAEDYDPTPVPEGCPSCWRGPGALDGGPCQRCPDPEAKARCRLERRGGLASRA